LEQSLILWVFLIDNEVFVHEVEGGEDVVVWAEAYEGMVKTGRERFDEIRVVARHHLVIRAATGRLVEFDTVYFESVEFRVGAFLSRRGRKNG
jgi:hypothetical protein